MSNESQDYIKRNWYYFLLLCLGHFFIWAGIDMAKQIGEGVLSDPAILEYLLPGIVSFMGAELIYLSVFDMFDLGGKIQILFGWEGENDERSEVSN